MNNYHKDSLTGLNDLQYLKDKYHEYIRNHDNSYLVAIDFTKFKTLNDEYGHHVGDLCLSAVGEAFKKYFSTTSLLIRSGGDEFLIITDTPSVGIEPKLHKCLEYVQSKKELTMLKDKIGFNCGVVDATSDLQDSLKKADIMMYSSKQDNTFLKFSSDIIFNHHKRAEEFLSKIDTMIDKGTLLLEEDRILDVRSQEISNFILYSRDSKGNSLFQDHYQLLRKHYRLRKIDYYNLNKVLKDKNLAAKKLLLDLNYQTLSSNDMTFVSYMFKLLQDSPLSTQNITLSINVDYFDANYDNFKNHLLVLKQLGFSIGFDNYSLTGNEIATKSWSLLPIDYMKINRDVWSMAMNDSLQDRKTSDMLSAVLPVFESHGTKTIFMGVETKDEHEYVKSLTVNPQATGKLYKTGTRRNLF